MAEQWRHDYRKNKGREGRQKTLGAYSINPTHWKFSMSTKFKDQSAANGELRTDLLFIHSAVICWKAHFLWTECCLMC